MSQINISHLTFTYDGSYDPVFEDVSFSMDTDWKLGLIGRNGRGKTTLLRLLMGEMEYRGTISSPVAFDYFPFAVGDGSVPACEAAKEAVAPFKMLEERMERCLAENDLDGYAAAQDAYDKADGYIIDELIEREAGRLGIAAEVLERPFDSLSGGERTKLLIAALFLRKGRFLLIDEPTNHLDASGRALLGSYLASKRGFLLVSHDRAFLDQAVDHILSFGRRSIEVQKGNYSSFEENRLRQDQFELTQNERLRQDIARLRQAARQNSGWSDRIERSKIGDHVADRGFIGHQSAKMMKRAKSIEARRERAVQEKEALLTEHEEIEALRLHILPSARRQLIEVKDLCIDYGGRPLLGGVHFTLEKGERAALRGVNGCGKSSILKLCRGEDIPHTGSIRTVGGLEISYVPQDTSGLCGSLRDYAVQAGVDESLFKAILRKLGFSRTQFEKDLSDFSGGQKKKVLIAASLSRPAHLLLWDEPLNFIDLPSRVQIEELLLGEAPTMLFVEHDARFAERIATKTISLG